MPSDVIRPTAFNASPLLARAVATPPVRPIPIRTVPRAAVDALVARLMAQGFGRV